MTQQAKQFFITGGAPVIDYSCVQGWIGNWGGTGNIGGDPLFVTGPNGDYYLSQVPAGQAQNSACVDTGDPIAPVIAGTTRTDSVPDAAPVDMGYHFDASQ